MNKIQYYCDIDGIEKNAAEQIINYAEKEHINKVCVFTDIHYCDEKAIPVGVAFSTQNHFYPLITGKDVGCGVMFLKIAKKDWLKPFNKEEHYKALNLAHQKMTDDGLGGGNHFLSLEEDDENVYVLCHTGTRNRGISLYQQCYKLTQEYSLEHGSQVQFLPTDYVNRKFYDDYNNILRFGYKRRKNFCIKTLIFLQNANYIKCEKTKIHRDYLNQDYTKIDDQGTIFGTRYQIKDSIHNHLRFQDNGTVIHRKGSTELTVNATVVIPLSMTRGSLLVELTPYDTTAENALFSCAHGAGRQFSRFDTMKYWKTTLKEKERKAFKQKFSEMLNRSNKFPSGYIQEFDFAYKAHSEIFKYQTYLKKITKTTPIVTIKYTEI